MVNDVLHIFYTIRQHIILTNIL